MALRALTFSVVIILSRFNFRAWYLEQPLPLITTPKEYLLVRVHYVCSSPNLLLYYSGLIIVKCSWGNRKRTAEHNLVWFFSTGLLLPPLNHVGLKKLCVLWLYVSTIDPGPPEDLSVSGPWAKRFLLHGDIYTLCRVNVLLHHRTTCCIC